MITVFTYESKDYKFSMTFDKTNYQARENNEIVFENKNYELVREFIFCHLNFCHLNPLEN